MINLTRAAPELHYRLFDDKEPEQLADSLYPDWPSSVFMSRSNQYETRRLPHVAHLD